MVRIVGRIGSGVGLPQDRRQRRIIRTGMRDWGCGVPFKLAQLPLGEKAQSTSGRRFSVVTRGLVAGRVEHPRIPAEKRQLNLVSNSGILGRSRFSTDNDAEAGDARLVETSRWLAAHSGTSPRS